MSSPDPVVVSRVAERFKLDEGIVARALGLLGEGLPIPYLARYRMAEVGGLAEHMLRDLRTAAEDIGEMEQRRAFILRAIAEHPGADDKLRNRIEKSRHRLELEYLYEPFRPPRKTPATVARDSGLAPLAEAFLKGEDADPEPYIDAAKGVEDVEQALTGARHILAERFAVDPEARSTMLRAMEKEGVLTAAPAHGKSSIPDRHKQFKNYEEKLSRVPPHRYLALSRAATEGAVSMRLGFPEEKVHKAIEQRHYPKECADTARVQLDQAAAEALRLMRPAVTDDALREAKARADDAAITVFANNLADLLLYPPAGPVRTMGIDPSPRGTIPVACVDERGQHLEHARLKFFDKNEERVASARARIRKMVETHQIAMVALGNGQGRHPCEAFLNTCFEGLGDDAPVVVVVNEVGVGSYASGPVGRAELPALPVPVRSAVSLARRLMDPLQELVKVDPKLISVGQYQDDVESRRLSRALSDVVEHCVSWVGVDINRAPVQQIAAVGGLTTSAARALVDHREKHGGFRTLANLTELHFISERAFEQAAGFLRIAGGDEPLDATGVHPAHADIVKRIAEGVSVPVAELIGNADALSGVDVDDYVDENASAAIVAKVLSELVEGGADPRPPLEVIRRPAGVNTAADLQSGMRLKGRVTNVTSFGAFVDIGVQQDGLVHVSELADRFIKDPTTVVHVGQLVDVRVLGVDADTGRISLSMKSERAKPRRDGKGKGRGKGRSGPGRAGPGRGGPRQDRRPRRDRDDAPPPPPVEPRAGARAGAADRGEPHPRRHDGGGVHEAQARRAQAPLRLSRRDGFLQRLSVRKATTCERLVTTTTTFGPAMTCSGTPSSALTLYSHQGSSRLVSNALTCAPLAA